MLTHFFAKTLPFFLAIFPVIFHCDGGTADFFWFTLRLTRVACSMQNIGNKEPRRLSPWAPLLTCRIEKFHFRLTCEVTTSGGGGREVMYDPVLPRGVGAQAAAGAQMGGRRTAKGHGGVQRAAGCRQAGSVAAGALPRGLIVPIWAHRVDVVQVCAIADFFFGSGERILISSENGALAFPQIIIPLNDILRYYTLK